MKEVITDLSVSIKAGQTFDIYLNDVFVITHSLLTLTITKASGIAAFKITNAINNSIELKAILKANQKLSIAYKVDNTLFDSTIEEFYILEITPQNDLEGVFSWSKDCTSELISIHAR